MTKHLGKKLIVGDIFQSVSKKHNREELKDRWYRKKGRLYRNGDKDYFIKGKRRYFCEVKGISQTSTGLHCWPDLVRPGMGKGPRWWQFTYVVQIIEN